jgi:large conductance mechanosensitive channel
MLKEFKDFAMKGNVVDLAIGVIIGAAFGKIVESMVGDIIMPLIGLLGNFDFSNLYLAIGKIPDNTSYIEAKKLGAAIGYGQFVTYVVNFIIIAWVLFLVVKGMNNLKRADAAAAAAAPEAPPADVVLLGEIRDLLAARK